MRHISYVLAVNSQGAVPILLLAYTSSGPWRGRSGRLPLGVMEFDEKAARGIAQKPFHLDLRCLAQLPLTAAWFPDLAQSDRGVVGRAGARLRSRIDAMLIELIERSRDLIEMRGPSSR